MNKLLSEVSDKEKLEINDFEEKAKQNRKGVEVALNWYETVWLELIKELKSCAVESYDLDGLLVLDFSDVVCSIDKKLKNLILFDIEKYNKKAKLQKLQLEWQNQGDFLKQYRDSGNLFDELISAVMNKEVEDYGQNYELLAEICSKNKLYIIRKALLEKLELEAPRWAEDVLERRGIHGENNLPEKIKDAWKWRQLSNQLERLDRYDYDGIQKEIYQISGALRKNAETLAYEKAWYERVEKIAPIQMQAIEGYRQTIK